MTFRPGNPCATRVSSSRNQGSNQGNNQVHNQAINQGRKSRHETTSQQPIRSYIWNLMVTLRLKATNNIFYQYKNMTYMKKSMVIKPGTH